MATKKIARPQAFSIDSVNQMLLPAHRRGKGAGN
jgi:hypothetical protein